MGLSKSNATVGIQKKELAFNFMQDKGHLARSLTKYLKLLGINCSYDHNLFILNPQEKQVISLQLDLQIHVSTNVTESYYSRLLKLPNHRFHL